MKHKVIYEYENISYGFEGEEVVYTATGQQFFNNDNDYLDFLDKAGQDETFKVNEHKSISDIESDLWYTIAKAMYDAGFYRFKAGTRAFYRVMRKSLRNIAIDDLTYRFDNHEKHC